MTVDAVGMVFAEFERSLHRPAPIGPKAKRGDTNADISRLVDEVGHPARKLRVAVAGPPDNTTATRSYPK